MIFLKKLAVLGVVFALMNASISCKSRQQQVLFEKNDMLVPEKNKSANSLVYLIKPLDLLQIRNLQNRKYIVAEPLTNIGAGSAKSEDNGQIYEVEDAGFVTLPILGEVKVAGLTRTEAANHIETLYRKELKDPIIELKIVNLKVTVLGEINKQGIYSLVKDRTSLVEIIGEAGGLTENGNSTVKIIRGGTEKQQVIEADLSNINTLSDPNIILQNNDIVYVLKNKGAIRAEKVKNSSSILQPVLLLVNTALIIFTLTR